uniref:AP-3 complex subunit beta n=1 Tax=Kwoniella bestiolae CBS 10118 TaxID=1296100 RepID=A0A1B9GEB0_9TREE|nr:AP-3 complex subunit beta [Kwoniella bestiolae CBS 10118]OCF29329.1 AP-3 complex subunit beta [Kwoniella bestiolae CBS 10118]
MAALNRLSQRIIENFQETTRDLSLLAGSNPSSTPYDLSDDRLKEISKLLESRVERERLEGMKRIIAGISKGRDMESFFAQVVKNVVSQSIEIRKLVYIYLLRFASTNSDLLLLSINTFQKDLSDPSPLIRSMSLRVLTSIRVPVIQGIVMLGLKKLVTDRNPWVRKTVAGGLAKVYEMDSTSLPQLIPLLQTLLSSPSPLTLGATLTAFIEICPDRLDLLHPYYRHIIKLLVDADEWGQSVALGVLTRYARMMLEQPPNSDEFSGIDEDLAMLLHFIKPLFQSRNPAVVLATANAYYHLAPSAHKIISQDLLVKPLLRLAGVTNDEKLGKEQISALTWDVIASMVEERPWLFAKHHQSFFLYTSDSASIQKSKLRALVALVDKDNAQVSIREFKHYVQFPESKTGEEAVKAIGYIVRTQPEVAASGLRSLMRLLKSQRDTLVAQAVIVLKSVILSSSTNSSSSSSLPSPQKLVAKLAKQLDGITNPKARASVYWLVGQFAACDPSQESEKKGLGWEGVELWVPDILRKGIKGFVNEATQSKLQIITLATKLLVLSPSASQLNLMSNYLFSLARYDNDYDVRDRARFLHALLKGVRDEKGSATPNGGEDEDGQEEEEDRGGVVLRREQVKVVILGKREIGDSSEKRQASEYQVGSMSRITGRKLNGYEELPEWTDDPTDSSLRDSEFENLQAPTPLPAPTPTYPIPPTTSQGANVIRQGISPVGSSPAGSYPRGITPNLGANTTAAKGKFRDLDAFLNSESESGDETESESDHLPPAPRAVTAPPRSAIVPEYDEDTSEEETDEEEQESESESEDDERAALYR